MKTIIVGTCGHIDHGKTSLIKALTGINTDRLKEEKIRGITIDLGFTNYKLPSGNKIDFVDVPGHEKFIRNMIAGITGVSAVLFVIAADEGVREQTIEHLQIIEGLGIKKGIIALTKCDNCDEEIQELSIEYIREAFKNTNLCNVPIVKVSSKTKFGIENLIRELENLFLNIDDEEYEEEFRMAVDRVFTVKGSGTVVTGTIIEGKVKYGDILKLYPSLKEIRVREVQSHGKRIFECIKGNRCALNITNVSKDNIKRGEVLSSNLNLETSSIIDCSFYKIKEKQIKKGQRVRVYSGTKEVIGRLYPLDLENKYIQLRLENEILVKKNDSYYIRNYSPVYNLGGGKIIEAKGKKFRKDIEKYKDNVILKEKGTLEERILDLLKKEKLMYLKDLLNNINCNLDEIDNEINKLTEKKYVKVLNCNEKIIIYSKQLDIILKDLKIILSNYHKKNPLENGMSKEELRKKLLVKELKINEFNELLNAIKSEDIINIQKGIVSLKGFNKRLGLNEKKFKDALITELNQGFVSVDIKLLKEKYKINDSLYFKILKFLEEEKDIVILNDGVILSYKSFNIGKIKIKEHLKEKGEITLATCRDILNTNRKIALAFLEELDKLQITKRLENKRVML